MFHFVDDEAAGAKRLVAMRGADADPDGDVADGERSDSMDAGGARDTEARLGFGNNTRTFLVGEFDEGFVFQACDRMALVVVSHPAFEGRESAATVVAHLALQCRRVQRLLTESE